MPSKPPQPPADNAAAPTPDPLAQALEQEAGHTANTFGSAGTAGPNIDWAAVADFVRQVLPLLLRFKGQ